MITSVSVAGPKAAGRIERDGGFVRYIDSAGGCIVVARSEDPSEFIRKVYRRLEGCDGCSGDYAELKTVISFMMD